MKVYKKQCANCLLSENRIVSPERARGIISDCISNQSYFICHKASMVNQDVCCKKYFDRLGQHSQLARVAKRFNAIKYIDLPESDDGLISYNDMKKREL